MHTRCQCLHAFLFALHGHIVTTQGVTKNRQRASASDDRESERSNLVAGQCSSRGASGIESITNSPIVRRKRLNEPKVAHARVHNESKCAVGKSLLLLLLRFGGVGVIRSRSQRVPIRGVTNKRKQTKNKKKNTLTLFNVFHARGHRG